MKQCPIRRLEATLRAQGILDQAAVEQIRSRVDAEIEEAVEFARRCEPPPEEDLYRNVYASSYAPW